MGIARSASASMPPHIDAPSFSKRWLEVAEIPDTFTDRYYLDYEGPAGAHTLLFRFLPATPLADVTTRLTAVITAMKAWVVPQVSFKTLRRAAAGSPFSFNVAWTPIVGTSATAIAAAGYPQFVSWLGRDSGGVRVRWTLHGASVASDADYRILGSENASVQAVITALAATGPSLLTVNGLVPFIAPYANTGYNAYFQRKRRKVA
jgi:hypothetical protein